MKLRILHQLVAVALASGVALTAAAQTGTSGNNARSATGGAPANVTSNATSNAGNSASGTSGKAAKAGGTHRMRSHASTHRGARTTHAARMRHGRSDEGMTSRNDAAETQYRGALRRCVEGPQGQRDTCLDQAIREHGHA